MKNKLYRKPLQEQIRTAKGEIKRLWHEVKGAKNKSVFKKGVKYSYIVDQVNKSVKIVPYNECYGTKGTVSHKNNGEVEIIDICNKTIRSLFEGFKQYKITVFKEEIIIEGYSGNTISVCTVEHIFRKLIEALPNVFARGNVVPIR